MVVQQIKELDIQRVGNMVEGLGADIDSASMPFVFGMVSKQLYSNPIGSVVREITSNCFDAHAEVDNTIDPVVINYGTDEEGMFIEFQDFGVGMSPDRINQIYRKYFSSTKRESNSFIGGWGLGSKTPLAYTEMFYITTVYEGVKYEYIYHKGEEKPMIDSLHGWNVEIRTRTVPNPDLETVEEYPYVEQQYEYKTAIGFETEERNGSIIKIIIKDRSDKDKFKEELSYQLSYFDSVFFKNWGINNDYCIYQGKYFKYRSDTDKYNGPQIHVALGKVRYPIDFNRVKVPYIYQKLPIAVKFEIGELNVVLSRENLEYNEKTIKLLEQRIKLAGDEIVEMFNAQNPEIETLQDWKTAQSDTPAVVFNAEKDHKLFIWANSGMDRKFIFKPLKEIGLKYAPNNLFFMWECFATIKHGIRTRTYGSGQIVDNEFILNEKYLIVEKNDYPSTYTDLYIGKEHGNTVYLIRRKEVPFDEMSKILKMDNAKMVAGKARTLGGYIKKINAIVREKGEMYSDWKASDEWIANYKRSIIESTAAFQRRKANKIFYRKADGGHGELTELQFKLKKGIVVYGFKEDKAVLEKIREAVHTAKPQLFNNWNDATKPFMCIIIAKAVEKDILGAPKVIHWEDFLYKTKFFKRIHTAKLMKDKLDEFRVENETYRKKFLPTYAEEKKALYESIGRFYSPKYRSYEYYIPDRYLEKVKLIDSMMKPIDDFIAKYDYRIPLIASLKDPGYLEQETIVEIANYLKAKKIRLHNKFYLKTADQLKEEARDKACKIGIENILLTIQNKLSLTHLLTLNQTEDVNIEESNTESRSETSRDEESWETGTEESSNTSEESGSAYEESCRENYGEDFIEERDSNFNNISAEDRSSDVSSNRREELFEESDERAGGDNLEEDTDIQQETDSEIERGIDSFIDPGSNHEEESGRREDSESESFEETNTERG